jgi:Protein of unknown function (DUF3240)
MEHPKSVLLTLIVPDSQERDIEDMLLSMSSLVTGFTSSTADGHGSGAQLIKLGDLITGHVPRKMIRIIGAENAMREVINNLRSTAPSSNISYWLTPVIESGCI